MQNISPERVNYWRQVRAELPVSQYDCEYVVVRVCRRTPGLTGAAPMTSDM
jgi:hypothetical protein